MPTDLPEPTEAPAAGFHDAVAAGSDLETLRSDLASGRITAVEFTEQAMPLLRRIEAPQPGPVAIPQAMPLGVASIVQGAALVILGVDAIVRGWKTRDPNPAP